jgi:hypothetical protein
MSKNTDVFGRRILRFFSCFGFGEVVDLDELKRGEAGLQVLRPSTFSYLTSRSVRFGKNKHIIPA